MNRLGQLTRHFQSSTKHLHSMTNEKATFAAGCFWGVEHLYNKHFKKNGITTKVGYIGGNVDHPSYRQVCTGTTDHAEALEITFDPAAVSYATLVEFFYCIHDPTTVNAQGPDRGSQYRSAIFYHSEEQKATAEQVTRQVQKDHYKNNKIVTEIVPAGVFYDAETYHQLYLDKNPHGYECPTHYLRW
ncbi:reductase [Absidia repens]|uniref:peptide-methionine (S)-S-oxide reductase n=1 Tax=Absidia repens TaxID=90262 RepID=A0A1X2IES3_9FUNG|nr:reductase [Absidia repens]